MKPRISCGWKTYRDKRGEARWAFIFKGVTLFKSSEGYKTAQAMKKALLVIVGGGCTLKTSKTKRGNPYWLLVAKNGETMAVTHYSSKLNLKNVKRGLDVIHQHLLGYVDILIKNIQNCVK